jgi:hypothetical protein
VTAIPAKSPGYIVGDFGIEVLSARLHLVLGNMENQDLQFVIAVVCQSAQLRSGIWITASRVNLPAIGQILSGKFEPESAIGNSDQSAWHGVFNSAPCPSR